MLREKDGMNTIPMGGWFVVKLLFSVMHFSSVHHVHPASHPMKDNLNTFKLSEQFVVSCSSRNRNPT